ncbi:MAG: arsenosugar biosynthesis radical SAM protein ArsS [Candidatus Eisenbacteria bacterium]|nr:arsenosugar biosynthesis radical SAM protein ArsS [Candidatus Eisenbacteria bacterium]
MSGSPRATESLRSRHSPLAEPAAQLALVRSLRLSPHESGGQEGFAARLAAAGWPALQPGGIEVFQINLGKLCNMTCRHCHVDAGPDRVEENMDRATAEACLAALDRTSAHTVDLTGGAPELNPSFRFLVDECVARGRHVMDRCNLTVLLLPKFRDLPTWLAERGVEVVCSLPHCRRRNTDAQRGDGTFERSVEAMRRLNAAGYGAGDPKRRLTVMVNPTGAFLAGDQAAMEREWKETLQREQEVRFDRLITLNNMPISRFLEWLVDTGNLGTYMERLTSAFNPATIPGLMCRNTLSISWDGRIFDCDFNQMLDMEARLPGGGTMTVQEFDPDRLAKRIVATDSHCFGCTAGAGSSCGGATAPPGPGGNGDGGSR